eukprot:TRINITY_DN11103_c0_g1_i1.p1 TRINITY_DN11103_c0_g1~~TRINITY_DN11103_c0_g1_i1.p1  ORF type:complete len:309 (-),score=54.24 TRINITY_DN11103_c0_g1_i1:42-968(-)
MDFVPAVILPTSLIKTRECRQRLQLIQARYGEIKKECLAICLHKADPNRFQIDFHEVEQKILEEKGFIKMIIRLIKYLRNVWKEPLNELSSHMIKSVVMKKVLSKNVDYWSTHQNLDQNFRECFKELVDSIEEGHVADVVWGGRVNILEVKVKDLRTKTYLAKSLSSLWGVLVKSGIDATFRENQRKSSRCLMYQPNVDLPESIIQHLLRYHAWSKHTSYQAATCTDEDHMRVMLNELNQLSRRNRAYTYTEKKVICSHCLKICETKKDLLRHIYAQHPMFRTAAEMALQDGKEDCVETFRLGYLTLN